LEQLLVQVEQASSRFVGLPPNGGTVEVQTELVAPAIQTWGFIKSGGTLRVFLLNKYITNTIDDDFDYRNINERAFNYPLFFSPSYRFCCFIFRVADSLEK
jgi:hypothetical protein